MCIYVCVIYAQGDAAFSLWTKRYKHRTVMYITYAKHVIRTVICIIYVIHIHKFVHVSIGGHCILLSDWKI